MPMASPLEVVIVHSSDLHLGVDDSFSDHDRLAALPKVLTAANKVGADVVVLAGDTFDNHRQPLELLEHAAQMLRDYRNPIVTLPGNHDPLTPHSVYRRCVVRDTYLTTLIGHYVYVNAALLCL